MSQLHLNATAGGLLERWDMGHTRERLHNALRSLVGIAPLRERLADAAHTLRPLRVEDFHSDTQGAFRAILQTFDLVKAEGGEGNIEASVRSLSNNQAEDAAREILELYHRVMRLENGSCPPAPTILAGWGFGLATRHQHRAVPCIRRG
jgi:hypothetical protein